ncbi:hypothetical protein HanXRQr2_Chr08g0349671 [Helianthus annuus]|uniref:Uncharacterized protein n=1 Tax=Helianthus annuus TaxID=4232 RepID=A0A251TRH6_HELAN|nr:hypothetical protein HanXRQr2_Chr08g0349671 [Helianthus annuus]
MYSSIFNPLNLTWWIIVAHHHLQLSSFSISKTLDSSSKQVRNRWPNYFLYLSSPYAPIWWYAKRFLHPDIVTTYDYTFIWDEDLGFEHFNADKYIQLVKKHGLEISQPGLEPNNGLTWQMTKWRGDKEVHKVHEEKPRWCSDPHLPPYAVFVEIMAPVFSRAAWRCVWHMIETLHLHWEV